MHLRASLLGFALLLRLFIHPSKGFVVRQTEPPVEVEGIQSPHFEELQDLPRRYRLPPLDPTPKCPIESEDVARECRALRLFQNRRARFGYDSTIDVGELAELEVVTDSSPEPFPSSALSTSSSFTILRTRIEIFAASLR